MWYEIHTADFVGLYTATGSAEFGPPPLGGPCGPPRTLWHAPAAALELDFGALYFRCMGVLNFGALYFRCRRVLSKAQLAGVQNPDPLVQTGLRIITLTFIKNHLLPYC